MENKQYSYEVVHCETQEEWDFVLKIMKSKGLTTPDNSVFRNIDTENYGGNCIEFSAKTSNFCWKNWYLKQSEYKIYSFSEWLDKFNHRKEWEEKNIPATKEAYLEQLEKVMEHKFKVGDRVVGNSNEYGTTKIGWKGTVAYIHDSEYFDVEGLNSEDKSLHKFRRLRQSCFDLELVQPKSLVGRWVKRVGTNSTYCGNSTLYLKIGEYDQIEKEDYFGYWLSKFRSIQKEDLGTDFELMPEGFIPPSEQKEEDWCVELTKENTSIIKKWGGNNGYSKGNYFGSWVCGILGQFYGIKNSNKDCWGSPWGKLLTTEEFYKKIGHTEPKKEEKWIPKVGDWVKRVKDEHLGMKVGDVDQITEIENSGIKLAKFKNSNNNGNHSLSNLVKALPHEIPTEQLSKEELLAEVKKRYPEGTIVNCANGNNKKIKVVEYKPHDFGVYTSINTWLYLSNSNGLRWAEIVEEAPKFKYEELIDKKLVQKMVDFSREYPLTPQECTTKLSNHEVNLKVKQPISVRLKSTENEVNIKIKQLQTIKL